MILSWQKLRIVLAVFLSAIYLCFSYLAAASSNPSLPVIAVGLAPLIGAGVVAAWKSKTKIVALVLCGVIIFALCFFADLLRSHIAWFYFLQHAGTMVFLGVIFGSTLGTYERALCSRIAMLINKTALDASYLKYTWKVTAAWTIYFIASAITSVALFFFASLKTWSLFASLLTPLFIGAMFAGEYLIRLRALPGREHFSISETIQAYRNNPRG